jgi:hypothetical protein
VPNSSFADEEVLVRDIATLEDVKAPDAESVLQLALKTIENRFT